MVLEKKEHLESESTQTQQKGFKEYKPAVTNYGAMQKTDSSDADARLEESLNDLNGVDEGNSDARENSSESLRPAEVVTKYKTTIESQAKEFGVDKYTIAAIIYYEQQNLGRWENTKDEILARNHRGTTSVGLGQIQVRRAIEVEDKVGKITEAEKRWHNIDWEWQARIDRLIDPSWNIRYMTAYLQTLQDARKTEFPAITSRPDILATVYNLGKTDAHSNPKANDYGKAVNDLIQTVKKLMG